MNGDDGHTFTEARYTACKLGNSLVPIKYSACVLKFRRGVAEDRSPWGIGCDGDMCARQSAHQKRNDYFDSFLSLYPRADRHSQVITTEGLMDYGLAILSRCMGWFVLTAGGGL
jgi:hypothetical protein